VTIPALEPLTVDVRRTMGMTVVFADDVEVNVDVITLRTHCPCADCRGRRDRNQPVGGDAPSIVNAELHGALGIAFEWNDGHSTGIHSWQLIRQLGEAS
jgi:DUF971 family protein